MTTLSSAVAIVTGGATGIGLAITKRMLQEGAKVVIADSGVSIDGQNPDSSVCAATAERLGDSCVGFSEHLNTPQAADKLIKQTLAQFGKIDIVVNNAAILRDGFVFKAKPDDWDAVVTNNLSTYFYLINAATPVLREQVKTDPSYNQGRIINMTSTAGFYGNFGQAAYASTKAGIFGLTRCVAHDMARSGITCNAIAPFAATRVTETIEPANDSQAEYKRRALQVTANFVAQFACYLCLEKSKEVTGQLFTVRGKEVFLFSQPRPTAKTLQDISEGSLTKLAQAVEQDLKPHFLALETDLEAFNTEPLI